MSEQSIIETVHQYLSDPESTWAVATFGAIAEFHREDGEEAAIQLSETGGTIVTEFGACRIDLPPDVSMQPYEFLSKRRDYWLHGIAFCLPDAAYPTAPDKGLREIGKDVNALNPVDRDAVLFDLGLGLRTMTAMVRLADPALIERLRTFESVDILGGGAQGHAVYSLLQEASPHRVFECPLGRVEVRQPIPVPEAVTPPGPHTHILPNYLASQRTHSANVPIPEGLSPCLHLYPPNPILTHDGEVKETLDTDAFNGFQDLLLRFGRPDLNQAKEAVAVARTGYIGPPDPSALTREERTATRVALRQAALVDPDDPTVADWQMLFEPMAGREDEDPDLVDES